MAHNSDTRARFLQILAETPFVNQAAKKVGVSRAQIYRWKKDNKEFREAMSKALEDGRENLIEVSEMSLVKKIRDGDTGATKYFLSHNSPRYRPLRPLLPPPAILIEERKLIMETHEMMKNNRPLPKRLADQIEAAWMRAGLVDENGQFTEKYIEHMAPIAEEVKESMKQRKDLNVEW
jgi:hypothetical protein